MASAEPTISTPVSELSYANAASKNIETDQAPVIDITTNGGSNGHPTTSGSDAIDLPGPSTPGEFEGRGLGEAPQSPTIKGHKRIGSRSSKGTLRERQKDEKPKHDSTEEPGDVPKVEQENDDTVVYHNGHSKLTSLRPADDYEASLRLDQMERTRNDNGQLVLRSGRIPSAGWERSGYVFHILIHP